MFGFFSNTKTKSKTPTKDELEEYLIECDIDYEIIEQLLNKVSNTPKKEHLREHLLELLDIKVAINEVDTSVGFMDNEKFKTILFFGINGAGKTTTIAKMANMYKNNNHKVLLGAGDTFRAGAIVQLDLWAKKLGVDIVKTQMGHDPSAVAYDTITKAKAKNYTRVLIDTSGRLQTQEGLMRELEKINKVCTKAMGDERFYKIMILDGMSGRSSLKSASEYLKSIDIDGVIVTKLDGNAKGGVVFSIYQELKIPVFYVGVGEQLDELQEFDKESFTDSLLFGIYE